MKFGWYVRQFSGSRFGGGAGAVYMSLYSKGEDVGHLPVATSASDLKGNFSIWYFAMLTWRLAVELYFTSRGSSTKPMFSLPTTEYQIGDRK